jgi:transposase InsO family protein
MKRLVFVVCAVAMLLAGPGIAVAGPAPAVKSLDVNAFIGMTEEALVAKYGSPVRRDPSEYGFQWYIYNRDYRNFFMAGVQDGQVVAAYTNGKTLNYKGQFKLTNNQLCYPLTICDGCARMILKCQALPNTSTELSKPAWVAAFSEYGLPVVIRTDNGSPFASAGLTGLSKLSAWWIRLGIIPERIQPGKPQQNGSHERMHRTLKEEVTVHPRTDLNSQQKAFDHFVHEYNYIRPHESLGQKTPASIYTNSTKEYPLRLPDICYPDGFIVRNVRTNGEIRWQSDLIFVSEVLVGEPVGLDQMDERHWVLYYSRIPLAILDNYDRCWVAHKKAAPTLRQLRKELNQNT